MRPQLKIQLKGTGGYKQNRYLYGGTGYASEFHYDDHITYDDSNITYEGAFGAIVRILYGDYVRYGGPPGTWLQLDSQPRIELIQQKTQTQREVINKPQLNIL